MLGERVEVPAVPGLWEAASGTRPPRGAAREVVAIGQGRGSHELQPDGKQNPGIRGWTLAGKRTAGSGEAPCRVRCVLSARERVSRGERIVGGAADDRAHRGI